MPMIVPPCKRSQGTREPRRPCTSVWRQPSALVPWSPGSVVPWFRGSRVAWLPVAQRRETGIDLVPPAAALPLVQVRPATRTQTPAVRAADRHHRQRQEQVLARDLGHIKHQIGTERDDEVLRAQRSPTADWGAPDEELLVYHDRQALPECTQTPAADHRYGGSQAAAQV